jgi:hypothetical protein
MPRTHRFTSLIKLAVPSLAYLFTVGVLSGCEGQTPQTHIDEVQIDVSDIIIPETRSLEKRGEARQATVAVSAQNASEESAEDPGACVEWITEEESYDPATGDFTYRYSCPEGGDIAEIVTAGHDDGMGNGNYTQTQILRSGDEIVWTYDYVLMDDGISQLTTGTSSEGESYEGLNTYLADGSTLVDETHVFLEGTYDINGIYDANGLFSGTTVFDDPATEASPDYTLVSDEDLDGSLSQSVEQNFEDFTQTYDYQLDADGSSSYSFSTDDLLTAVSPDYAGSYSYAADGSGEGSYTQLFDDGSMLDNTDVFDAEGNLEQTWTFDDAATALDVDQTGSLSYTIVELEDGSLAYVGEGSVTYFLDDDSSVTCGLTIDAEGNTELGECE